MVEKIIVQPENVRAYGNILESKTLSDYSAVDADFSIDSMTSEEENVYNLSSNFYKLPTSITLTPNNPSGTYGDNITIAGTTTNVPNNTTVTLEDTDGYIYTGTVHNNAFSITYPPHRAGNIGLIVRVAETDNSTSSLTSALGTVAKSQTTVAAVNATVQKGHYFEVSLKDHNNNPVQGETVQIVMPKATYEVITDEYGIGKLMINMNPTSLNIGLSYMGNNNYLGDNEFIVFTVTS